MRESTLGNSHDADVSQPAAGNSDEYAWAPGFPRRWGLGKAGIRSSDRFAVCSANRWPAVPNCCPGTRDRPGADCPTNFSYCRRHRPSGVYVNESYQSSHSATRADNSANFTTWRTNRRTTTTRRTAANRRVTARRATDRHASAGVDSRAEYAAAVGSGAADSCGGRQIVFTPRNAAILTAWDRAAAWTERAERCKFGKQLFLRDVFLREGEPFLGGLEDSNRGLKVVVFEAARDHFSDLIVALGGESDHAGACAA